MDLLETPFRYVVILLVCGATTYLLSRLGQRSRVADDGWQRITPGPSIWFSLIVGIPMVIIFVYVRLFVGSGRADAVEQMRWLSGLIVAFGLGVAWLGWSVIQIQRQAIRWRGDCIAYRHPRQGPVVRPVGDVTDVERTTWGWVVMRFADGDALRFSESARGADELLGSLPPRKPQSPTR